MKSIVEFEDYIQRLCPRGYGIATWPASKTVRIRSDDNGPLRWLCTITLIRHDRFSIHRGFYLTSAHPPVTVHSKMMLEQELFVLFTLDRMGAL